LLSILGGDGQIAEREGKTAGVDVVGSLIKRVKGLAMVHRMLSRSKWEPVPLCMLATEVLQAALNALPPDKYVCIKVTPSPVVVSPKQAANLALIFNELMINTVKYGLEGRTKGKVDVEIACHDGWIDLVYRDDGAGYTEAVLEGQERNIGLHLLQRMIKTLHGKLDVSNDNGAVTRLRFPARLPLAGCVSLLGKGRHRAHQLTDKVT